MIPENITDLTTLEEVQQPSLTYKLNLETKRIAGLVDGQDAVMQAIQKILNTERYAFVIYDSEYGVELETLIGKDYDFIVSEIERRIEEALLVDDRVLNISNFVTEKGETVDSMVVTFDVSTIYGVITLSMEVNI